MTQVVGFGAISGPGPRQRRAARRLRARMEDGAPARAVRRWPRGRGVRGELCRLLRDRACVGVGNGTDALELILAGLGIGQGDEVIVPTNTFVATAEAVCAVGATPPVRRRAAGHAADRPDAAAACRGPGHGRRHRGAPVRSDGRRRRPVRARRRHGLAVIEDAAQAHGARLRGRRAGSVGAAAAFSFYPGKNLGALGDGGAVVTPRTPSSPPGYGGCANHGRGRGRPAPPRSRGRNSRLDTLQAALLSVKLAAWTTRTSARPAMASGTERSSRRGRPVTTHPPPKPCTTSRWSASRTAPQ